MEKKRKQQNRPGRFFPFLLTLALVLGAVGLVVFREEVNVDALKRYITYRSLTRDADGRAESFPYDGSSQDVYAVLNGSLLVAGGAGIRLYSPAGVLLEEDQTLLTHPAVSAEGRYAVVYDLGGNALRLYSGQKQLLSLDSEGVLLSASVNAEGWLAVTHQSSGHKGAVTVFDARQERRMQFNFSSRFVCDALVNGEGQSLAVVAIGQEEGSFQAELLLYPMDAAREAGTHHDAAPSAQYALGSVVPLALAAGEDALRLPGDRALLLCGPDPGESRSYDYDGRYLKDFSLGGEDYTALLLSKYRSGNATHLIVVGEDGQVRAQLETREQILSLSAAGRYIGVLTADRLDIYTSELTLYSTLEGTLGAHRVLLQSDGSALLIGSAAAQVYLPN